MSRGRANVPDPPDDLREGVRQGILDALAQDLDRSSVRTVRRLAAAGALGMAGAVACVWLFAGDGLEKGRGWQLAAVCAAAWAGLLVACVDVVLLRIRIERLELTQACLLALVGLGLAAMLSLFCPDPRHLLAWWSAAPLGDLVGDGGGGAGAFCLGACSALAVGGAGTLLLALVGVPVRGALPGILLFVLLAPGALLQSAESPAGVLAWWSAGLLAGAYAGVRLARWPARRLLGRDA